MVDASAQDAPQKKSSKLPLIIGAVLMLVLGGGGFYATYSGLILGGSKDSGHADGDGHDTLEAAGPLPDVIFVPVNPILVTIGSGTKQQILRFSAQLEVVPAYEREVVHLMPRVLDVLNGYLRAVETRELQDTSALVRLRAQMLRRVQIVTGEGRVRDLLVTEFVLN